MKITKNQLRRIIKEEKQKILVEYSEYASWDDLQDSIDDISEMLDMVAAKYVTSGWLSDASAGVERQLEQLYADSEALGQLISKVKLMERK